MARRNAIVALLCVGAQPLHALSVQATATGKWGGALAAEAKTAIEAVQNAMQLCNALACEMAVVDSDSQSAGKTMDACDTTAGVSFIKPGDDTPVTAADFAIQGLVSAALKAQFPDDRFMGEEDAGDLRDDADLRSLALKLCSEFGGPKDEAAFIDAVDRGLEPNQGKGERVWVLDPIDGTKGFMTGQNFVVGLALLDSKGDALIGVMGVPPEEDAPPIMAAVKGHGLRWWPAVGDGPISYDPPAPEWSEKDEPTPPWLVSPQKSFPECAPFGADHAPDVICCGGARHRPCCPSVHCTACTRCAHRTSSRTRTHVHVSRTHVSQRPTPANSSPPEVGGVAIKHVPERFVARRPRALYYPWRLGSVRIAPPSHGGVNRPRGARGGTRCDR